MPQNMHRQKSKADATKRLWSIMLCIGMPLALLLLLLLILPVSTQLSSYPLHALNLVSTSEESLSLSSHQTLRGLQAGQQMPPQDTMKYKKSMLLIDDDIETDKHHEEILSSIFTWPPSQESQDMEDDKDDDVVPSITPSPVSTVARTESLSIIMVAMAASIIICAGGLYIVDVFNRYRRTNAPTTLTQSYSTHERFAEDQDPSSSHRLNNHMAVPRHSHHIPPGHSSSNSYDMDHGQLWMSNIEDILSVSAVSTMTASFVDRMDDYSSPSSSSSSSDECYLENSGQTIQLVETNRVLEEAEWSTLVNHLSEELQPENDDESKTMIMPSTLPGEAIFDDALKKETLSDTLMEADISCIAHANQASSYPAMRMADTDVEESSYTDCENESGWTSTISITPSDDSSEVSVGTLLRSTHSRKSLANFSSYSASSSTSTSTSTSSSSSPTHPISIPTGVDDSCDDEICSISTFVSLTSKSSSKATSIISTTVKQITQSLSVGFSEHHRHHESRDDEEEQANTESTNTNTTESIQSMSELSREDGVVEVQVGRKSQHERPPSQLETLLECSTDVNDNHNIDGGASLEEATEIDDSHCCSSSVLSPNVNAAKEKVYVENGNVEQKSSQLQLPLQSYQAEPLPPTMSNVTRSLVQTKGVTKATTAALE